MDTRHRNLFTGFLLSLLIAAGCATERHSPHRKQTTAIMRIEDPNHDCHVNTDDNQITMRLPGTAHDFASELETWNAPRALAKVSGDFNIEVRISGTFRTADQSTIEGRRPYNGAGLLIVQDKHHHLSLQRGAVRLGNRTRHYANLELRDGSDVSSFDFDISDDTAWLRLERRGNRILAYACNDHQQLRAFRPIEVTFPDIVEIGIVGINSAKKPFAVTFSDLNVYERLKLKIR
jgi:regulation of enolase protein 1 (concanavalin A-like superfamily)